MALTKVNSVGIATGISLTGITTTQDAKIGTGITLSPDGNVYATGVVTATSYRGDVSNCTGVGQTNFIDAESLSVSGISTLTGQATVGTGITLSPDGDVFFTGVVTATSYAGDGSGLTGIAATDNVRTGILDVAGVGTFRDNVNVADRIIHVGDTNCSIRFPAADTFTVETNGTERVRVDSGGRLLIATTDIDSVSDGEVSKLIVKSTDSTASATFVRHSADAGGSGIYIGKSRNATIGSNTIVQDDDELGRITFSGDDGTNINTIGARIQAFVDGTPGENDMPGRLTFSTTADGAASVTERLRIHSTGSVTLGKTSTAGKTLEVYSGSDAAIRVQNSTTGTGSNDGILLEASGSDALLYNYEAGYLAFGTSGSERLRITSAGKVGINTVSPTFAAGSGMQIRGSGSDFTSCRISAATKVGVDFSQASDGKGYVYNRDNADLIIGTNNTERFRIGSAGQLGIGGATYGSSGQVLTSGGASAAPSWAAAAAGIEISHQWRLTSSSSGNQVPLTGWELVDTYGGGGFGTAMSESSGIFTFPSTGWWLISFQLSGYSDNSSQNVIGQIETTTNNSSYTHTALGQQGIYDFNNSYPSHALVFTQALFDVTDTSTHKCRLSYGAGQGNESVKGSSTYSYTNVIFTRLGDT